MLEWKLIKRSWVWTEPSRDVYKISVIDPRRWFIFKVCRDQSPPLSASVWCSSNDILRALAAERFEDKFVLHFVRAITSQNSSASGLCPKSLSSGPNSLQASTRPKPLNPLRNLYYRPWTYPSNRNSAAALRKLMMSWGHSCYCREAVLVILDSSLTVIQLFLFEYTSINTIFRIFLILSNWQWQSSSTDGGPRYAKPVIQSEVDVIWYDVKFNIIYSIFRATGRGKSVVIFQSQNQFHAEIIFM